MSKSVNDTDLSVGRKILQLRLSAGMTRQDLAEKLGITHQQLQKYEKGVNRISVSRLVDIAKNLNVSISTFFNEVNENLEEKDIERQRICMEMMRDFIKIQNHDQQQALRTLIKTIACS